MATAQHPARKRTKKQLTVKELQDIKVRLQTSSMAETAVAFNRAATIIRRIKQRIQDGTFDKAVERARRLEKMGPTNKAVNKILELHNEGLGVEKIANQLKITKYTVIKQLKQAGIGGAGRPVKDYDIREQVHAMRGQGMPFAAISDKLNITKQKAYYHAARPLNGGTSVAIEKVHAVKPTLEMNTNGHRSNGEVNKHILIGIAYAETERFIGLLSERLGLAIHLLRPRLSELLGHPPIR